MSHNPYDAVGRRSLSIGSHPGAVFTKRLVHLFCLLSVLALSSRAEAQRITHAFLWNSTDGMRDLGTLPGWGDSYAYGISPSGLVVGNNIHGFIDVEAFGWTESIGMHYLKGLVKRDASATGVNNAGQVVGQAGKIAGPLAYLWSRTLGVQNLGTLGGWSTASGINSKGDVIGYSLTNSGVTHPFLWTQANGMEDLLMIGPKTCPACEAFAFGISDSGLVVGQWGPHTQANDYAFVWRNGRFRVLSDFGGVGEKRGSVAYGVNKVGQVVGTAYTSNGTLHAFLWSEVSGMQDLGTLPGGLNCTAQGINASGQVVGWCQMSDNSGDRAFLWSPSTGMQDIGTLGGSNAQAFAINDAGLVVGCADLN